MKTRFPAGGVGVVLVAGGRGRRFGPAARKPKQFLPLAGKPLLYWSLRTFQASPAVSDVVVVVPRDFLAWTGSFLRRQKLSKVSAVVEGGPERADSVWRGYVSLPRRDDVVLVHDAARPLVTREIVTRVAQAARRYGAALAAWPVPDTVKVEGRAAIVRKTMPRQGLWLAQTPQGLRRDWAEKYLPRPGQRFTDDVQRAEKAGRAVQLVLGAPQNFKVTLPEDFKMCERLLKNRF